MEKYFTIVSDGSCDLPEEIDPEAMKVIERVSPMLMYFLSTGNQDYFYESIQSLEKLFYMGFTREIVDNLRTELSKLLDMEEE